MWPSGVLLKVVHSSITTRASIPLYSWLLWMQTTSSSMWIVATMTRQQRIYNYRLSKARRIVENGILASRFRCRLTTMPQKTKTVESLVLACCCLHNLMRIRYPTTQNNMLAHEDPVTHQVNPGAWWEAGEFAEMPPHSIRGNYATRRAKLQ